MHVDILQRVGILLELRIHFEHDVILVQLRENRGHLPLPERVIQRVVNRLRQNSQPGCCVAINREGGLHPALLLIAGHVGQLIQISQFIDQFRSPLGKLVSVRVFHRVLELRAADAVFHGQVLHGLQIKGDSLHIGQTCIEPANDRDRVVFSLFARLQIDLNAAAIGQHVRAVHTDKGRQAHDIGILQYHFRQSLLALGQGRKRKRRRGFRDAQDDSGILHGEKSFGNNQEEENRKR